MARYFRRVWLGLVSLITGMGVTIRHMFRKPVTLQYPHTKPVLSGAYRSAIKLIRFEETDSHDCVACLQCEKICPSFCITIEGEKVDGLKKKRATKFDMDFALCSLCGLCLDVCPTTTLEYSRDYDVAGYTRDGFVHDLLDPYRAGEDVFREQQRAREAEAKRQKAEEKRQKAEARKREAEAKAAAAAAEPADPPASDEVAAP